MRNDSRIGGVYVGDEIAEIGLDPKGGIDIVAVGKDTDEPSDDGVPGTSVAFQGDIKISNNVGCGQHGGLGKYEQSPFLLCAGAGFQASSESKDKTSAIDIAPTAMRHLDLNEGGMDGRALQS